MAPIVIDKIRCDRRGCLQGGGDMAGFKSLDRQILTASHCNVQPVSGRNKLVSALHPSGILACLVRC